MEPTESNDIKRAASEIMAAAVRQTEERVAEVRRRAEDAVNQVGKRHNFHQPLLYHLFAGHRSSKQNVTTLTKLRLKT